MGIQDLFQVLKKNGIVEHVHMSMFKGKTAAIDGFGWLYKASYTCSKELYEDPLTPKVIDFCERRILKLIECGVKPFFVFDGRTLPLKHQTYQKRKQIRDEAIKKINYARKNNSKEDLTGYYQQCVLIGYKTMKNFIDYLQRKDIPFVVAPYEADPQLAYLVKIGLADIIISDDSDLLVYKAPIVLFQLNYDMQVDCLRYQDILNLKFSDEQFIKYCILCGCDYLPRVKGLNHKLIYQLVTSFKSITNIIKYLKNAGYNVPNNYISQFKKAYATFNYQMIYDIIQKKMLPFSDISEPPDYIGEIIPPKILEKHINGQIDPRQNE